jgi:hypothetical protein
MVKASIRLLLCRRRGRGLLADLNRRFRRLVYVTVYSLGAQWADTFDQRFVLGWTKLAILDIISLFVEVECAVLISRQ